MQIRENVEGTAETKLAMKFDRLFCFSIEAILRLNEHYQILLMLLCSFIHLFNIYHLCAEETWASLKKIGVPASPLPTLQYILTSSFSSNNCHLKKFESRVG
jgi:hypothetical protein